MGLLESTAVAFRLPLLSLLRKKGPGSKWLQFRVPRFDEGGSLCFTRSSVGIFLLESRGIHATDYSSLCWLRSIVIEGSRSGPLIRGIPGRVSINIKSAVRSLSAGHFRSS